MHVFVTRIKITLEAVPILKYLLQSEDGRITSHKPYQSLPSTMKRLRSVLFHFFRELVVNCRAFETSDDTFLMVKYKEKLLNKSFM